MTNKKSVKLNSVLVCGRCNIELVESEVVEREMKDDKGKLLARTTSTIKHCPRCFNQSVFKYVLPDQVKVYEKNNKYGKT